MNLRLRTYIATVEMLQVWLLHANKDSVVAKLYHLHHVGKGAWQLPREEELLTGRQRSVTISFDTDTILMTCLGTFIIDPVTAFLPLKSTPEDWPTLFSPLQPSIRNHLKSSLPIYLILFCILNLLLLSHTGFKPGLGLEDMTSVIQDQHTPHGQI